MLIPMHTTGTQLSDDALAQRRRLGHDRFDEVWDGVLHMVPPATAWHQLLGSELLIVLSPIVRPLGLRILYEAGLFDPIAGLANYRQPDVAVVDPRFLSERGIEGRAELVVEILSPNDESRAKLPFYARHQTQEVWIIDPTPRTVEVFALRGDDYVAVSADPHGVTRSPRFELDLTTLPGPLLGISWPGGHAEI